MAWNFLSRVTGGNQAGSEGGLGYAERHYLTMSLREIKELPIQDIAARDCHLSFWTTGQHLPQAFEVITAGVSARRAGSAPGGR
jgi:hypothetical protein